MGIRGLELRDRGVTRKSDIIIGGSDNFKDLRSKFEENVFPSVSFIGSENRGGFA